MLALICLYIFATAKPISIRRLSLLFGLALISTILVSRVLQGKAVSRDALFIATLITVLAWIIPLLKAICSTACHRTLSLEALCPVSPSVKWTYGFALAFVPLLALTLMIDATHRLTFVELLRLILVAGLLSAISERGFSARNLARRPFSGTRATALRAKNDM